MKKLFTILLMTIICATVAAQENLIKNFSFETWYNTSTNVLAPAIWSYDEDAWDNGGIERHSSGSDGLSALRLNIHSKSGQQFSTEVYQRDSLKKTPSSLSFAYNVFNYNHIIVDRLVVAISFYKDSTLIKDYKWSSHFASNTDDFFKNVIIKFNKLIIDTANIFQINIKFDDYGGHEDEYALVDNFKFVIDSNSTSIKNFNNHREGIITYPNPTTGILNYSLTNDETVKQVVVTSIDGKQTTFQPTFTNTVDISTLANGIYSVAIIDEDDKIIGTQKVVLTK